MRTEDEVQEEIWAVYKVFAESQDPDEKQRLSKKMKELHQEIDRMPRYTLVRWGKKSGFPYIDNMSYTDISRTLRFAYKTMDFENYNFTVGIKKDGWPVDVLDMETTARILEKYKDHPEDLMVEESDMKK